MLRWNPYFSNKQLNRKRKKTFILIKLTLPLLRLVVLIFEFFNIFFSDIFLTYLKNIVIFIRTNIGHIFISWRYCHLSKGDSIWCRWCLLKCCSCLNKILWYTNRWHIPKTNKWTHHARFIYSSLCCHFLHF